MAVPPNSQWNTGPTQRLPRREVHAVGGRTPQRPRSRRMTCGMAFLTTLIIGLLVLGGGAWWLWYRYQNAAESVMVSLDPEKPQGGGAGEDPRPTPDIVNEPFNILLIGVDIRPDDDSARSDTMIMVHVDPQNKWASMLSIPRDNCAPIPGITEYGECMKINAAYSEGYKLNPNEPIEGGMRLTRDALEDYLNLADYGQDIDYVMQVNFDGFKDIIDTIGGININVEEPLFDPTYPTDDGDYGFIRLFIPAGFQHMDGVTALRYARSRHTTADYGRAERQQQVIKAILQGVREQGLFDQIDKLDKLSKQLDGAFRTNLPIDDVGSLRALASLASALTGDGRISNYTLGPFENWTGDAFTPRWDDAEVQARVEEWLMGPSGTLPQANQPTNGQAINLTVEVMNGAQIRGLAGEVTDFMALQGYTTTEPSTADDLYDETMIIDFGDQQEQARQLAMLLGVKPTNIIKASKTPETPADPTVDLLLIVGRDYKEAWRGGR